MASHADLVFLGNRYDALEEVGNPLPVRVRVYLPGNGQRRILLGALVDELAVARSSASRRGAAARDADDREVVLDLHDAGARAVANHLADVVDVAIAVGTRPQIDRRHLGP